MLYMRLQKPKKSSPNKIYSIFSYKYRLYDVYIQISRLHSYFAIYIFAYFKQINYNKEFDIKNGKLSPSYKSSKQKIWISLQKLPKISRICYFKYTQYCSKANEKSKAELPNTSKTIT